MYTCIIHFICVCLLTFTKSTQGNYSASAKDGALEEAQHNKLQMICDKLMLQVPENCICGVVWVWDLFGYGFSDWVFECLGVGLFELGAGGV